jgi:hypothetical protein
MQLFVLGMHRSGTSGVTRILNMAGAYFGPEGISNGADEGNPKGHWERLDVRAACDGLLQESGFDWWRVSGFSLDAITDDAKARHLTTLNKLLLEVDAHRPWVLKEPRLSLLFPLLRPRLEVPICIHVSREPLEIGDSLHTRNGFPAPAGIALWEVYTIMAFRGSAGLPRVHVHYEDLVGDPVASVTKLITTLGELGVYGLRVPSEREITSFITPELHRARHASDERLARLNQPQVELAAAIDDESILEWNDLPDPSEGAIVQLRAFEADQDRHTAYEREIASLTETLADDRLALGRENARLGGEVAHLEKRIAKADRERERAAAITSDVLNRAEADIRAVSRSRTVRLAGSIGSVRRALTPGAAKAPADPFDKTLRRIERSQEKVGSLTPDAEEAKAAGTGSSNGATEAGRDNVAPA